MIRICVFLICLLFGACWLANLSWAQVQLDLGAQEFAEISASMTDKPEVYLGLAALQLERGEAVAALATVAQGLAQHPGDSKLLEQQADIYATQPAFLQRAADLYKRLLAQRPATWP